MPRERIVSSDSTGEEENRQNYALRPTTFAQYIGQESLIRKLKIAVSAARSRNEPVDHTLLHGPPGLGRQRWRT
jgi:Holliday junction DNA helicase RuvB